MADDEVCWSNNLLPILATTRAQRLKNLQSTVGASADLGNVNPPIINTPIVPMNIEDLSEVGVNNNTKELEDENLMPMTSGVNSLVY